MSVCNVADSATIGAVFNNVVTRSEAWVVVVDVVVADVVFVIFVVMVVIIVVVFAVVDSFPDFDRLSNGPPDKLMKE